jgi:alpha-L-fucosidase
LKTALQGTGVKFGVYHAMLEWFHPLYLEDKANNYKTHFFPKVYGFELCCEKLHYKSEVCHL